MLGPEATPLSYSTQLRSSRSAKSEKVRIDRDVTTYLQSKTASNQSLEGRGTEK